MHCGASDDEDRAEGRVGWVFQRPALQRDRVRDATAASKQDGWQGDRQQRAASRPGVPQQPPGADRHQCGRGSHGEPAVRHLDRARQAWERAHQEQRCRCSWPSSWGRRRDPGTGLGRARRARPPGRRRPPAPGRLPRAAGRSGRRAPGAAAAGRRTRRRACRGCGPAGVPCPSPPRPVRTRPDRRARPGRRSALPVAEGGDQAGRHQRQPGGDGERGGQAGASGVGGEPAGALRRRPGRPGRRRARPARRPAAPGSPVGSRPPSPRDCGTPQAARSPCWPQSKTGAGHDVPRAAAS